MVLRGIWNYFFCLFINHLARYVCWYIGEIHAERAAGSTYNTFSIAYSLVTTGQILFKFGTCMQ